MKIGESEKKNLFFKWGQVILLYIEKKSIQYENGCYIEQFSQKKIKKNNFLNYIIDIVAHIFQLKYNIVQRETKVWNTNEKREGRKLELRE